MYIDNSILSKNIDIPTIGKLDSGDTFFYGGNLYMKCEHRYGDTYVVNLSDGTLHDIDDCDFMNDSTGITPISCAIRER